MCFYLSVDNFIPVLLAFVVLDFFLRYQAWRLAGMNIPEMTYFMSNGM